MDTLKSSVSTMQSSADQLASGSWAGSTVPLRRIAVGTAGSGRTAASGSQSLTAGIIQLADGSGTLESGVSAYTGGVAD